MIFPSGVSSNEPMTGSAIDLPFRTKRSMRSVSTVLPVVAMASISNEQLVAGVRNCASVASIASRPFTGGTGML